MITSWIYLILLLGLFSVLTYIARIFMWAIRRIMSGARCPSCSRSMKRRRVPKSIGFHIFRCAHCGIQWKRRRPGVACERFTNEEADQLRRKLEPMLSPDALRYQVDDTTCGTLLGIKRRIDPSRLTKPAVNQPHSQPARKRKAIFAQETTVERLLGKKTSLRTLNRDNSNEGEDCSISLWDRWLDG